MVCGNLRCELRSALPQGLILSTRLSPFTPSFAWASSRFRGFNSIMLLILGLLCTWFLPTLILLGVRVCGCVFMCYSCLATIAVPLLRASCSVAQHFSLFGRFSSKGFFQAPLPKKSCEVFKFIVTKYPGFFVWQVLANVFGSISLYFSFPLVTSVGQEFYHYSENYYTLNFSLFLGLYLWLPGYSFAPPSSITHNLCPS